MKALCPMCSREVATTTDADGNQRYTPHPSAGDQRVPCPNAYMPVDDAVPKPPAPKAPRRAATNPLVMDDGFIRARCPYCEASISNSCLATTLTTGGGALVQVWLPLVCPECKHPLFAGGAQRVVLPGGQLS